MGVAVWLAFGVHVLAYLALGFALRPLVCRFLPPPYSEAACFVPALLVLGLMLIPLTLPHWHLMAP